MNPLLSGNEIDLFYLGGFGYLCGQEQLIGRCVQANAEFFQRFNGWCRLPPYNIAERTRTDAAMLGGRFIG